MKTAIAMFLLMGIMASCAVDNRGKTCSVKANNKKFQHYNGLQYKTYAKHK